MNLSFLLGLLAGWLFDGHTWCPLHMMKFRRYLERIGDPSKSWWPRAAAEHKDDSTLRVGVVKALAMAVFIPTCLFIFLGSMHGLLW